MIKKHFPYLKIVPIVSLGLLAGLVANITTDSDIEKMQEVDPDAANNIPNEKAFVHALEGLQTAVVTLSKDVRRMNITLIQYEYLTRESARLEKAADLIDQRIAVVRNAKEPEGYRTRLEDLKKLQDVRDDVRKQMDVRNDAIQKLVIKLESLMNSELSSQQQDPASMEKAPEGSSSAAPDAATEADPR